MLNNRQSAYHLFFLLSLACFFVICCLYPASAKIFPNLLVYDAKRLSQVGLLVFWALLIVLSPVLSTQVLQLIRRWDKKVQLAWVLIFSLGVLSALHAPQRHFAFQELCLATLLFCLTLGVATLKQRYPRAFGSLLLFTIIGGATLYLGAFFTVYLDKIIHPSHPIIYSFNRVPGFPRLLFTTVFPGFTNVRFFMQYQIWTLPLISLPVFMLPKSQKIFRSLLGIIAVLWWSLAILNAAKGALVALAITALILACLFKRDAVPWFKGQVVIVLTALLLTLILFQWLPVHAFDAGTISTTKSWTDSASPRLLLGEQAIHFLRHHPWLGIGPGMFAYLSHPTEGFRYAHPHNGMLLFASEWGLPAAALLIGLLLLALKKWASFAVKNPSALVIALTASALAGLGYSFASGVTVMPMSQLLLAVVAGWMIGAHPTEPNSSLQPPSRFTLWSFRLLLLATVVYFLQQVLGQLTNRVPEEITYLLRHGGLQFAPRFWLQGLLS